MLRLTRLVLRDFRNYESLSWRLDPSPLGRIAVITGPNGSGKTNLLEAVSLLVPGRGLRGARGAELARRVDGVAAIEWGVAGKFQTGAGVLDVGTGTAPGADSSDRRVFRIDGVAPRVLAEVAQRLAMVWLTPQMDGLFQEPASGRRRFLDRLVYALEPGHAREIAAHDSAQAQRARLLAGGGADAGWLAGLERSIARHAVAATAARMGLVARLNAALAGGAAGGFPTPVMSLACPIGERLAGEAALVVEDWLCGVLAAARRRDAQAGSAGFGAQRADMDLADAATGRAAGLASTGQQKALLIGVVLGHAALVAAQRGMAPLLLLDEPAVHLDTSRRAALCAALAALPGAAIVTGTDAAAYAELHGTAAFWKLGQGSAPRLTREDPMGPEPLAF